MQVATIQAGDLEAARDTARQAADVLAAGGLVVFPTETVYGVAASVLSDKGLAALHEFKRRPAGLPFTVHLADPHDAGRYVDLAGDAVLRRLVQKVFPGPVTLLVESGPEGMAQRLAALGFEARQRHRLYHEGVVSLRCPDDPLAYLMLQAAAGPIVAASVNRPGEAPAIEADQAAAAMGGRAALVIDGGRCRYAKPSTVVRVRRSGGADQRVVVERPGVFDERFIQKLLRWTLLLVCSGNTCRSPMAEAIARQLLGRQQGVRPGELEGRGVHVVSAGVGAQPGLLAAPEAIEALAAMDCDLSGHRSRPLTPELIHEADVIYCMTAAHRQAVVRMAPWSSHKVFQLDPGGDIEDPIGAGLATYQRTAETIRRGLEQRLKEQQA